MSHHETYRTIKRTLVETVPYFFSLSFRHCKCLPPKFPDNCKGDHTCTNSKQCGKHGKCVKFGPKFGEKGHGAKAKKYAFQVFYAYT